MACSYHVGPERMWWVVTRQLLGADYSQLHSKVLKILIFSGKYHTILVANNINLTLPRADVHVIVSKEFQQILK